MDVDRTDLVELLTLQVLEAGALHGYGVYKELLSVLGEGLTSGRIYSVLRRLEGDGLVAGEEEEGPGPKKLYVLTDAGHAALERVRQAPEGLRDAAARLFGLGAGAAAVGRGPGRAPGEVDVGTFRDVTVHRDLVRDRITITLERGPGGTADEGEGPSPAVERLLRQLLGALLR